MVQWPVFLGNIVVTAAADLQMSALSIDAQLIILIHFIKSIIFYYFPNTFFKKSFSIYNWPTSLNISAFSFPVSSLTMPFSKTVLAPDKNFVFKVEI